MPTKCICHKSFSGYSSVVDRSKFRVDGQETTPKIPYGTYTRPLAASLKTQNKNRYLNKNI